MVEAGSFMSCSFSQPDTDATKSDIVTLLAPPWFISPFDSLRAHAHAGRSGRASASEAPALTSDRASSPTSTASAAQSTAASERESESHEARSERETANNQRALKYLAS